MVKLNLSAMQNNATETANITENDDSIKQVKSLETKSETFNVTPIQKKKMSLNSLISGTREEEITDKTENLTDINIVSKDDIIAKTQEEMKKVPNKSKISLGLLNTEINNIKSSEEESQTLNQETIVLDIKKEEKLETLDETKIEAKKEEVKTVSISDGDTIWNLITDLNKTEIFAWYVSSFDKEMELLKNKNTKKESKIEKNKKSVIVPEISSIEKEEIDLDKIIENVKTKEEPEILEESKIKEISVEKEEIDLENPKILEEKINTPLENLNKSKENIFKTKKNFKTSAIIFTMFILIASWFFYYLNLDKTVKDNSLKVNVIETNNHFTNQIKDNNDSINNIKTIENNINNTTRSEEVKQKLIKYFKNKQNSVKIQ